MAGKGSRQRTFGSEFDSNYDRIFRKDKVGTEWVAEETSQGSQRRSERTDSALPQYPQEAREDAQKGTQRPSWDTES
jgi:hypothetical protein